MDVTPVAGLTTLQAERTRYRNRYPQSAGTTRGVADAPHAQFPARLATTPDGAGVPLPPPGYKRGRALDTWRLLQAVETERHRVRRTERQQVRRRRPTARTPAQRLARLRGIAARSATVLADGIIQSRSP